MLIVTLHRWAKWQHEPGLWPAYTLGFVTVEWVPANVPTPETAVRPKLIELHNTMRRMRA